MYFLQAITLFFFLMSDGTINVMGSNNSGQLGLVDASFCVTTKASDQSLPVKNPYLSDIIKVIASGNTSLFLRVDGRVFGCGNEPRIFGYPKTDDGRLIIPTLVPDIGDVIDISMNTSYAQDTLYF